MPAPTPALSVVTSLYRSASSLREFHRRMTAAARQVTDSYEIIYVDDGSPDESGSIVRELAESDPHVVLLDLSRNFGQGPAMFAGLAAAAGEQVFVIDSDLEEAPEHRARRFGIRVQREVDAEIRLQRDAAERRAAIGDEPAVDDRDAAARRVRALARVGASDGDGVRLAARHEQEGEASHGNERKRRRHGPSRLTCEIHSCLDRVEPAVVTFARARR